MSFFACNIALFTLNFLSYVSVFQIWPPMGHVKHSVGSHLTRALYVNEWIVEIEPEFSSQIDRIADKHGFINAGPILTKFFVFVKPNIARRSMRKAKFHDKRLKREKLISKSTQLMLKLRVKRNTLSQPNDPGWNDMWYLNQRPEHNVQKVWQLGITGKDVVVSIMDDGLEFTHPDISRNYDSRASYDLTMNDPDPTPNYQNVDSRHGTRCAGEVAAVFNNSFCIVGVAYDAHIGGLKMLDGLVTDAIEAASLSHNMQHVDIYSASWGPEDNGRAVDGPGRLARLAFKQGVEKGRNGKGSIFVWASGNGGQFGDNCNCDGYSSSIYTLTFSSATEAGSAPWYSETCSSSLASTYSSGSAGRQIVTTDINGECTSSHTGTSASAPLAAGMCALALEANPQLTWRDLQHIVIRSASPEPVKNVPDWQWNKAGRQFSHWFGYGLIDAFLMVQLARRWVGSGAQKYCEKTSVDLINVPEKLSNESVISVASSDCAIDGAEGVVHAEHVQATISIQSTGWRGNLQIFLVSPHGTKSTLLSTRVNDASLDGFVDWPLMSVHFWGESVAGNWKLEISNTGPGVAKLSKWTLSLHGTSEEVGEIGLKTVMPPALQKDPHCCAFSPLDICTGCLQGRLLYRNLCLEQCPDQYAAYDDPQVSFAKFGPQNCTRRMCKPCPGFCSSCPDPQNFTNNRELQCSLNCIDGFSKDPSSGRCLRLKWSRATPGRHLSNNYDKVWKLHALNGPLQTTPLTIGICLFLAVLLFVLLALSCRIFLVKKRAPLVEIVQLDSKSRADRSFEEKNFLKIFWYNWVLRKPANNAVTLVMQQRVQHTGASENEI